MKIRKSSLLLLLITLYGVNHFFFERRLFLNEVLSAMGFLVFVKTHFTSRFTFLHPRGSIERSVLFFLFLTTVIALVSIPIKTNWYFYFRNLSIIYSTFCFFLGYALYEPQYAFFQKAKKYIYGYALLSFGLRWDFLIDRNAYAFWFAHLRVSWALQSVLALILLYVLYVLSYTSLTVVVILMCVLAVRYFKGYSQLLVLGSVALLAFAILFVLAIPYMKLYKADSASLFGNVMLVYEQHPWFLIDTNSSWRTIFWYRVLVENFPYNLIGVGIGTPLLPYTPGLNSTGLPVDDATLSHVIGTHNTFITLFARFGILAIVPFIVIYHRVLKDFFQFKPYYLRNRNDGGIFLGFVTITCVGLFNLLIESVTLAGLYWISLGFVARAIDFRKYGK